MNESVHLLERTVRAPREAREHVFRFADRVGPERTEDAVLLISEQHPRLVRARPVR
jgi:hypothetical protein